MRDYDDDTGPGTIALMRSLIENPPDAEESQQLRESVSVMARGALATFCRRVTDGRIKGDRDSQPILAWMAESISTFLEDADKPDGLEKALHLRGRVAERDPEKRFAIAYEVKRLLMAGKPLIGGASSGAGAISIVAGKFNKSEKAVEKIYYSFGEDELDAIRLLIEGEQQPR